MDAPRDIQTVLPRLVFFDVTGRRDLARRAAAAAPGVRFVWRRSWTGDPGAPRRSRWGDPAPRVGLWLWRGTVDDLAARANDVLLGFVHPLVARGLPFCVGFPFAAEAFAPRHLGFGSDAALDLEDIGRLLGATSYAPVTAAHARAAHAVGVAAGAGTPPRAPAPDPPSPSGPPPPSGPPQPPLDAAQRAAVEHAGGPARVLAPAGAGKTKTLVARVVRLIDRGADPSRILLLAFNRKAAEQLEERLAAHGIPTTRRLGSPPGPPVRRFPGERAARGRQTARERPSGVHCATFNAFGYRYQREVLGARIAVDLTGAELRALMRRAIEASGLSLTELRPTRGSDPVGAFLGALPRVRAALESPDEVEIRLESAGRQPIVTVPFGPAHERYARAQQATGRQSFDDQIYFAVADMLADPTHRAFVQDRFEHLLVDEFQDLNGAQLALVDVLSRPSRDLYVVGDDDQLIYGWRQADPRGILEFHRRMPPRPFSATYTLGTNYRCSRAVVESSARLVANNAVREAKDVRPRDGAEEGALRFAGAPSWPERAAAICAFLRAERARLACDWRDLAVLCRYRTQQLLVALTLDDDGIPRTPTLGCRLFTYPAARLLRAYIDLLREPDSVPAADLAFLLERPNRYLGRAALAAVGAAKRPWAHVREGAASEPAAGPRPLSALVAQVEALGGEPRASRRGTLAADLLWTVVDEFGLEDHWAAEAEAARRSTGSSGLSASDAAAPDTSGPYQVLDSLHLLAELYPDPSVYLTVWDRLRADEEAHADVADDTLAREEAEEDRVVIGTIHAAKGREYRSVVIPEYACDVSQWEPAEVEEERRVVYVGVTRARSACLFTVDTSILFVQPFLRELVETPDPDEEESLGAWLAEETDEDLRRRIVARLDEIQALFPEPADENDAPAAAG